MPLDWAKCIVCQEDTNKPLKCPLNGPKWLNTSDVYSTFLSNVSEFRLNGQLPCDLKLSESTTVQQLIGNSAV